MSNKHAGNKVVVLISYLALFPILIGIETLLGTVLRFPEKYLVVKSVIAVIIVSTGIFIFLWHSTVVSPACFTREDLLKVLNMEWKSFSALKTELEKLKRRNRRSLDKSSFGPTEAWLSGQLIDLHEKGWIDIRLSPQSCSPVLNCPCQGEYQLTFSGLSHKDKSQGNKLARHGYQVGYFTK